MAYEIIENKKPFIAYKKVYYLRRSDNLIRSAIAVLKIPAGALVNQDNVCPNNKQRANTAIVLKLIDKKQRKPIRAVDDEAFSGREHNFKYKVGEHLHIYNFDKQPWACSTGIHFFRKRIDAYHW